MKKISKPIAMILIVLFLSFISFTGCSSTPKVEAFYSFSENESKSAKIEFDSGNPGVSFINFEGTKLPKPKRGTRWSNTITFPAEEPSQITVRARYDPPTPMLDIGGKIMEFGGNLNILGLPFLAVGLGFVALAFVVDVPMAFIQGIYKKVVFDCLPLEVDKSYVLKLRRKRKGETRALLLLDAATNEVVREQAF